MSVESVNSEIAELNVELKVCLKALNNYDKDEFFIDHPVYRHLFATDHGARLEFLRKEKEQKEEDLRKAKEDLRKKEEDLRKEKEHLWKKEEHLRERDIHLLRERELLLLKAVPPSTRPPRSPISSRKPSEVPPSTGKDRPNATTPKDSPSSNEGKIEGLKHASDDKNTTMQCTSHPCCVELMKLLYATIEERNNKTTSSDAQDDKFAIASKIVIANKNLIGKKDADTLSSERFFTGLFANAMNAVLDEGFTTLHQACIGSGATHSDLSVCRFKSEPKWPITLLVGEGKKTAEHLRRDTRGQLFNELLRHRSIEYSLNKDPHYYGPILLLAFDKSTIDIDLAFPSKRGGQLERDTAVFFHEEIVKETETFWTVQLLRTKISSRNYAKSNLAIVLQFLSSALKRLDSWQSEGFSRVHFKLPMPLSLNDKIEHAIYYNENVSKVTLIDRRVLLFKEYCYNLRQDDLTGNQLLEPIIDQISKEDQRVPPPDELLQCLGEPYSSDWKVYTEPFGCVLQYPFIDCSSSSPNVLGWIQILCQVANMHTAGYVHGDLLPRNVLFGKKNSGFLIDFDLSRKENKPYVRGFNFADFEDFRHPDAKPCKQMKKIHDVHSLCQISHYFFDLGEKPIQEGITLKGLIAHFKANEKLPVNAIEESKDSSGSPNR